VCGHPKCEEVKQNLKKRHQPFIDNGWVPEPLGSDATLHRLVKQDKIDSNTNKPSKSAFADYGLSVVAQSANYPIDMEKYVKDSGFIGAVKLDVTTLEEMGYEIMIDLHPDQEGNPQHPNHVQVVCNKTQGNTKKMRDICEWSVHPPV
jgi:hypothetical protein